MEIARNAKSNRSFIVTASISAALVLLISLSALYFIINATVRDVIYDNVIVTAQRDKQIYANEIDTWFRTVYGKVETLAEVLSAMSYPQGYRGLGFRDWDQTDRNFIAIAERIVGEHEYVHNVFIGFADGSIINGAGFRPPPGGEWQATHAPWFSAAVEAGEGNIIMTEPYWSNAHEAFTAGIATWLPELNDVGAVVGISVSQTDIFDRIAHDPVLGDGYRMIVARGGAIIFHSNPLIMEDENINTIFDLPNGDFLAANFREVVHIANFYDEDLGESYFVSARLPSVAWTLLDIIPASVVQDPIAENLTTILIPIGILIVLMYLFAMILFVIIAKSRGKTEAVAIERDMAEASDKAKSRFLARMSHELRTPITAVLGISEIELQKTDLPTGTEESFAKIHTSANRLLSMVNDVLDLSKIESNKTKLHEEEYEVKNLIIDVTQLHPNYQKKEGIEFRLNVDENLPTNLLGDAMHIEQIVSNLLSNAFKYTETGAVELSWQRLPHDSKEGFVNLFITVTDTGYGMSDEQIETLGQSEYLRFHETDNRYVSGTGLGMSIVYSLLKLMDAEINIESKIGVGTKIEVCIPQRTASSVDVLGKEVATQLQQREDYLGASEKNFKIAPIYTLNGNVLVVDDIETNCLVAQGLIEPHGLSVETCDSGYETIRKIKQGRMYDIIFLDIMMPEFDGIKTMTTLREMGYTGTIIALTASALIGEAEKLIESGFDDFLSKPIQTKNLQVVLHKHVKDKQV